MRRGTTRDIHFPGNEGGFVESKTMICQTNMAKGAWGRPCGGVFLVPLGTGNKRGGLRIYHNYRRHLFKLFTAFKAGRTPPLATAKRLCQSRHKKRVTQFFLIARCRYLGESTLSVGATCRDLRKSARLVPTPWPLLHASLFCCPSLIFQALRAAIVAAELPLRGKLRAEATTFFH